MGPHRERPAPSVHAHDPSRRARRARCLICIKVFFLCLGSSLARRGSPTAMPDRLTAAVGRPGHRGTTRSERRTPGPAGHAGAARCARPIAWPWPIARCQSGAAQSSAFCAVCGPKPRPRHAAKRYSLIRPSAPSIVVGADDYGQPSGDGRPRLISVISTQGARPPTEPGGALRQGACLARLLPGRAGQAAGSRRAATVDFPYG
jgi:hypothetical protein